MSTTYSKIHTDFSGGLMSKNIFGRIDLDKYSKGGQTVENFLPTLQGPIRFREGFQYLKTLPSSGNHRLIPFEATDENSYVIVLSDQAIDVFDLDGVQQTNTITTNYLAAEIPEIRWSFEPNRVIFVHKNHPPAELLANIQSGQEQLYSFGASVEGDEDEALVSNEGDYLYSASGNPDGATPWTFQDIPFISHPYQEEDTSSTVLRMSQPREIVRLESDDPGDFVFSPSELANLHTDAGARWVEYKVNNQWSLGRILSETGIVTNDEFNYGPNGLAAPAGGNPTGGSCYVDPVDAVLNIASKSTQLLVIDRTEALSSFTEPLIDKVYKTQNRDIFVFATEAVFSTDQSTSWLRVGDENALTSAYSYNGDTGELYPVVSFANSKKTTCQGYTTWVRLKDYRGLKEVPVDFLKSNIDASYDAGSVYEVVGFGATGVGQIDKFETKDVSGNTTGRVLYSASSGTSSLFTMNTYLDTYSTGTVVVDYIMVSNLTTRKQMDSYSSEFRVKQDESLIQPLGTIVVYDQVTDSNGLASHTTTLTANTPIFSEDRFLNRFVFGKLGSNYVTLQITSITSTTQAECSVFSSVPFSSTLGELEDGGVFSSFRLGAWYAGNYPKAVSFMDRRRIFGGTTDNPGTIWFSKVTDPLDFRTVEYDGSVLDTTGITYSLGSKSVSVQWLASGKTLIAGTNNTEWQLRPNEFSAAISPTNIRISQETTIGSRLTAEYVNDALFFPAYGGVDFIEFFYNIQRQSFETKTATKLVDDLFHLDPIVRFTYQSRPHSAFWVVTSSGALYSLTYRQEDDYYAWAKHPTQGTVLDVASVTNAESTSGESLMLIVERSGAIVLEKLADLFTDAETDNYRSNGRFLDSWMITTTGTSGIVDVPSHLISNNRATCVVDGVYVTDVPAIYNPEADLYNVAISAVATAAGDALQAQEYILVGLPYTGTYEPMPNAWQLPDQRSNAFGRKTRLTALQLYLKQSVGFSMVMADQTYQFLGTPTDPMYTGWTEEYPYRGNYASETVPKIVHDKPYPLTIISAIFKVEVE